VAVPPGPGMSSATRPAPGWLTSRSPPGVQASIRAPGTRAHTRAVQPAGTWSVRGTASAPPPSPGGTDSTTAERAAAGRPAALDAGAVARAEHTRWYERRRAAGWRARATGNGRDATRVNSSVVPWADLPGDQRAGLVDQVCTQLAQLEDVGFLPVVPGGGPDSARPYRRFGTVRAWRLDDDLPWTSSSGTKLSGHVNDWHVRDEHGDERTVRDAEFQVSHEPLGGDRWRRTGRFRAWRVAGQVTVRTVEGPAVARAGDWIVEGSRGERWPVADEQFQRSYEPGE
jgi:hypothetical protein